MLLHLKGGNALTCAICIDLVTDIDEFLTSDTTEDQIVQFVEQVFLQSHLLLLDLEIKPFFSTLQLCKALGTILPDFEVPQTFHLIFSKNSMDSLQLSVCKFIFCLYIYTELLHYVLTVATL